MSSRKEHSKRLRPQNKPYKRPKKHNSVALRFRGFVNESLLEDEYDELDIEQEDTND